MTDTPQTTKSALCVPVVNGPLTKGMLERIALEIGANVAANIDQFYPGTLNERALLNVRQWARCEVLRWFGKPEPGAGYLDARVRASAAHRRHLKRLRNIAGAVAVGDAIDPVIAAMDQSAEQARLDYRAGGPVIEGCKQ